MLAEILLGLGFVAGTVVLTLACYFAMRAIAGGEPEAHTKDLASSVIFRISALHGLILALVFAQEMVDYQQIRSESAIEANAVADIYFDTDRYDTPQKAKIQDALFEYVRLVIDEEWQSLGRDGALNSSAWGQWDVAYSEVLNLVPATERQRSLRDHMLDRIHAVAETRVQRGTQAADAISPMFWLAAMVGVVFIALAYYSYPPKPYNLLLICMFGAFTGIVLYFIYAFSNPFSEPGALKPVAYHRLQQQMQQARAATGS